MSKAVLIIMARAPRLGAVKSRLARDIGPLKAWQFYRSALFNSVQKLTHKGKWQTSLQITPDRDRSAARQWPKARSLICQGRGGLGTRMNRGLTHFGRGVPVVLIGSDIPTVSQEHIQHAFHALRSVDVVFGPATDGGYWLVGFANRRPVSKPFKNVRWSSQNALNDTLANMTRRKVKLIQTLSDVDDGAGYRRWRYFSRKRGINSTKLQGV